VSELPIQGPKRAIK